MLIAYRALTGTLGANPISDLTNRTGLWSLRLLLATLAVTPLRRLSGWVWLMPARRLLGLFAFFYGLLHFAVYLALNQTFSPTLILGDLSRPFIIAGYLSFALMVPLAATSTVRAMRALGPRWQLLHRLVYAVAILAVLHYLLLVKIDFQPPEAYGALLTLLLSYRLAMSLRRRIAALAPRHAQARTAQAPDQSPQRSD
ncbi:MAG: protein-methionine-sulfoxide reductase heme-binding subunit MsrQ [Acidiferrobacteraceae bacterium]